MAYSRRRREHRSATGTAWLWPGPKIETFAGGTKIDAGPPKFSEIKSRKVFTQIWS